MKPSAAFFICFGGALAVFVVVYFWNPASLVGTPEKIQDFNSGWPQSKTDTSLKFYLKRLSAKNKKIISIIARNANIYANELAKKVRLNRSELVYRCKELESKQLIEVIQLTDLNFRIHENVLEMFDHDQNEIVKAVS